MAALQAVTPDDGWALGAAAALVAGLDITPVPRSGDDACEPLEERAVASLVVLSLPGLRPVHSDDLELALEVPYIPGYLGFRSGQASRCPENPKP
jgi:deoxyinosine 3'endonuclease (endonuclease V)